MALVKLMGLQLSAQLADEVLRARVSLALDDPARVADILPEAPGPGVAALPDYAALLPDADLPRFAAATPRTGDFLYPVPPRGMEGASNAWAAAPKRSAAGGTLLANDPHMGFSAPAIWYLARLDLDAGGVIGGTIPGIPAILSGRSERLGWGVTAAYVDDLDIYVEKLNPDAPDQVLTPEGWRPMDTAARSSGSRMPGR